MPGPPTTAHETAILSEMGDYETDPCLQLDKESGPFLRVDEQADDLHVVEELRERLTVEYRTGLQSVVR